MELTTVCLVLLCGVTLTCGQTLRVPSVTALSPQGIRFTSPDQEGLSQVVFHYSVNEELPDGAPGHHNEVVMLPTDGKWVHENKDIVLREGHVVNFWVTGHIQGQEVYLFNQRWTHRGTSTHHKSRSKAYPNNGTKRKPGTQKIQKQPLKVEGCLQYPCLVFEDNFDTFDFSAWQHELTAAGGGNGEFEVYTNNRSNSYVHDGVLYIKPTLTSDKYGEAFLTKGTLDMWGSAPANMCTNNKHSGCRRTGSSLHYLNPVQSARIRTVNSFSFTYGRIEVEAQMPKGDWLWPAAWLLPKYDEYGNWPVSGEIDLVESRGNADLRDPEGHQMGHNHSRSTLVWGPYSEQTRSYMTTGCRDNDFADSFHNYTMVWEPESLRLLVDEDVAVDVRPGEGGFWKMGDFDKDIPGVQNPWRFGTQVAPFDKEFYIILNVAVGGTGGFFGDGWVNAHGPKPWKNHSPTAHRDFWAAKDDWYPTWNPYQNNGEDAALKVTSVRVWKTRP